MLKNIVESIVESNNMNEDNAGAIKKLIKRIEKDIADLIKLYDKDGANGAADEANKASNVIDDSLSAYKYAMED